MKLIGFRQEIEMAPARVLSFRLSELLSRTLRAPFAYGR